MTGVQPFNGKKLQEMPMSDDMKERLLYAQELPKQRQSTHGDFDKTALIAQALKQVFRSAILPRSLPATQQEAAELILTKLARIASGNAAHSDHWGDIAGYAVLVVKELQDGN